MGCWVQSDPTTNGAPAQNVECIWLASDNLVDYIMAKTKELKIIIRRQIFLQLNKNTKTSNDKMTFFLIMTEEQEDFSRIDITQILYLLWHLGKNTFVLLLEKTNKNKMELKIK